MMKIHLMNDLKYMQFKSFVKNPPALRVPNTCSHTIGSHFDSSLYIYSTYMFFFFGVIYYKIMVIGRLLKWSHKIDYQKLDAINLHSDRTKTNVE